MIKRSYDFNGRKLFEEMDMPLGSKIVSEDPINKIAERKFLDCWNRWNRSIPKRKSFRKWNFDNT
jgi:hypothetical protein